MSFFTFPKYLNQQMLQCDMPFIKINCKKQIKGLGGDPICFVMLLVQTLNVLLTILLQLQGLIFVLFNVTL